jgi:tetratricopeptide (TPR) repeat protein
MRIAQLEAEAWVAVAEGRHDVAVRSLRQAATLDATEVGESVVVPAREMLADLLLELRRPAEARHEYDAVLRAAPNRFNALVGAARASMALGARASARAYYRKLVDMAAPDADREELREARASLEQR